MTVEINLNEAYFGGKKKICKSMYSFSTAYISKKLSGIYAWSFRAKHIRSFTEIL